MDSDLEVARARLGRTVGNRWLLERVLGTGGMAAVYAGRAPDGAIAAIKILHPEMGARREVRERFLREGSAADKIGHPGVVRMLGQGDGEEAFLAMELLEGETLRDRVRRHGKLPLEEVLDYTEQVLDVLVMAHERGVVHRDLKPDNLFVTLEGRLKVLDFGLARLLEDVPGQQKTRTGVALGTLAYMAPEQALGRRGEIDGRVDLFAVGATMFRVLSGRRVHEAESEAELLMAMASRPAPPLKSIAHDVPEGVASIVDLSLAFSRDARYPDARTMLTDVQTVRRGGAPAYAASRLASRDERTRPDQPAFSANTQPFDTVRDPVSQRTVPLAAYTDPTAPYSAPSPYTAPAPYSARTALAHAPTAPQDMPGGPMSQPAPHSARAPVSTRTEPLAQVPVVAPTLPSMPVPAGAPPVAVTAPPKKSNRGLLALLVVLGTLSIAAAGGLVVYFMLAEEPSAAGPSPSALPSPLPSPETAAAAAKPANETTRAAEPAVTAEKGATELRTGGAQAERASPAPNPTGANATATASARPAPTPEPTATATTTATATGAATATATASAAPEPTPTGKTSPAPTPDAGAANPLHHGGRKGGRGPRN